MVILLIVVVSFIIGACLYSQMPERMASHWNAQGEVDGYMPKLWGLFLMPLISVAVFLLFVFMPRIDPLKANIEKFRKYFDIFIVLVALFLLYLYLLTILWNLGVRFSLPQFLAPAFGVLFYDAGVLIKNAKRNYFIGIRTPWTLNNDAVWEKTHQIGGRLFKTAGLIALLGIFFPRQAIFLVLVPVILFAVYTIIYSYFEYRKVIRSG